MCFDVSARCLKDPFFTLKFMSVLYQNFLKCGFLGSEFCSFFNWENALVLHI